MLVTLGSKGYRIYDGKRDLHGSCIKVKAVDTTAAGDTFSGALVAELARGATLESAAAFAGKCASIACTRLGAIRSVPERHEVEEFKL